MDIKKITSTKYFARIVYAILALIVLLIVFRAGMIVGYHKAKFSFQMGENYYRMFEGTEHRGMPPFNVFDGERDLPNAHGVVGKIIRVEPDTLSVIGKDDVEKTVLISKETSIRKFRQTIHIDELKLGDDIVVIGTPNDNGEIVAQLIRIIPPPDMRPPQNTQAIIPQ